MSAAIDRPDDGPLAQSVRIIFIALYAVVGLFALSWLCGNISQIPPDSRAVILRFGNIDRVVETGLALAWPRPIEEIRLLPARGRQIDFEIKAEPSETPSDETDVQFAPNDDIIHLRADKDADNAAYLLTGDSNAVRLDATLVFTISDPKAYILAESRLHQAIKRLYRASCVEIVASHHLDDFLVTSDDPNGSSNAVEIRDAMRHLLVQSINNRLQALKSQQADLGIELSRIDLAFVLPPVAKAAFDEVLTASQTADQVRAAARTDATRILQEAARDHDRLLTEARAAAEERLRTASADTAAIEAIAQQLTPTNRDGLLAQAYRDQIGKILQKAGKTIAVDPLSSTHMIIPGGAQIPAGSR